MNTKKIAGIVSFIAVLACANFANAADHWTPLVRIPGLPATGHVDLSMYLVGLYNFLLSIVGIVAVMMLIIGGMRYITAAGNSAAISDAKDIVSNAIIGLLLALLSWVFIATINPDVLYIKQPGSGFNITNVHGTCYKYFDHPALGDCICIDGVPAPSPPYADKTACNDECYDLDHCKLPDSYPCIATGSPNDFTDKTFDQFPYNGKCHCIDDVYVEPHWVNIDATPGTETCNDVCSNVAFADPHEYHGIKWDLRVGEDLSVLGSADRITLPSGVDIYHDLSQIRDCTGRGVHVTIDYSGSPAWLLVPDRWCCFEENSPAGLCGGWANICNVIYPECHQSPETDIYPPPNNGKDYPIWKHSYGVAGLQKVWVGASYKDTAGNCHDVAHIFDLDIK